MSTLIEIQPAPSTLHGAHRITHLPILLLNLHSRCNCRCVMCDIWRREDSETYDVSSLERHRSSLLHLGVEHVVLTGGEPLLHPEFAAVCAFFRQLNIRITVLTTGLLLASKANVIAEGVDEIILSLDGPPEIHNTIRRIPRAFETIARGVNTLRQSRPTMPISARTTLQKLNHAHLRATVDAAHLLALDKISFLPADLTSSAFNRQEAWAEERQDGIALTQAELDVLENEIEALVLTHEDDLRSGFIVESQEKLRRLAQRFREHLDGTPPQAPRCNAPWVSSVIEVNGSIRPCFFHPVTGSTRSATLEEALNSEAATAFRSRLDVGRNPVCQRCVCSLNYRP